MKIKVTDINVEGQTDGYVLKVLGNKIVVAQNSAGLPSGGTTAQYLRGDGSWQNLNKAAVGLGNVDNTSDANKPLFTSGVRGLVPPSGSADSTYFLNASGNWSIPAGSGGGGSTPAYQWANPVTATGTGASQNITLPESGLAAQAVIVKVSGIVQHTSEYTISGTTLTLTTNAVGAPIEIIKPLGLKGDTGATGATGAAGANGIDGAAGAKGDKGDKGDTGSTGATGPAGANGANATFTLGTVSTGAAGSNVIITNTGNNIDAVLNFTIPRGDKGDTGLKGDKGDKGDTGATGPAGTNGLTNARRIISPAWSSNLVVDVSVADVVRVTLAGSTTLAFSNAPDGHKFTVELTQDATGGRSVTLNGVTYGSDVPAYSSTTAANKMDVLVFYVSGSRTLLTGLAQGF